MSVDDWNREADKINGAIRGIPHTITDDDLRPGLTGFELETQILRMACEHVTAELDHEICRLILVEGLTLAEIFGPAEEEDEMGPGHGQDQGDCCAKQPTSPSRDAAHDMISESSVGRPIAPPGLVGMSAPGHGPMTADDPDGCLRQRVGNLERELEAQVKINRELAAMIGDRLRSLEVEIFGEVRE